MNRQWYKHFMHEGMFVFKEEGKNKASGWDCKGNKFKNEFHFIDNRYTIVTHPDVVSDLNNEFNA